MHGLQTIIKDQEKAAGRLLHADDKERVAVAHAVAQREAKDAISRLEAEHRAAAEERLAARGL